MADYSSKRIWALTLALIGGTASLPAQSPAQTVSAERQILLHVKFAGIDQEKEKEFGVNLLNGPGSSAQALNLFTLDPKLNLGAFLRVLQNENILEVLAEPNLVTTDGKDANFLVGGEFPIPVVQGGAAAGAITVQFRKYGLNLTFTPTVTTGAKINMRLKQEVSTLDLANAVVLNGFSIRALSTRSAESTVELGDGQSFVVAGMVNDQEQTSLSKVPFISSIPLLGSLVKSNGDRQRNDLIMIVTPEFVPSRNPVIVN
jgi:pilus assembly protein CpaC